MVNSLAERFYREHGVTRIEPGYDLRRDFRDLSVMRMRYCLRREMGTCLKEHPAYKGKLYLRHEQHLYELQFDCARCMMTSFTGESLRDRTRLRRRLRLRLPVTVGLVSGSYRLHRPLFKSRNAADETNGKEKR